MPTPLDLIRRLVKELMAYDIEISCLNATLASMRSDHPEFPTLQLLREARQYQPIQDAVQERYQPLLEALDTASMEEIWAKIPPDSRPN